MAELPKTVQFDFSDAPAEGLNSAPSGFTTMAKEDFDALQQRVFTHKAKLLTGEVLTLEEEREINIWFRERRGIAMTVNKPKETKPKKAVATGTTRKTPVKKEKPAQVSIDDLFAGLF